MSAKSSALAAVRGTLSPKSLSGEAKLANG